MSVALESGQLGAPMLAACVLPAAPAPVAAAARGCCSGGPRDAAPRARPLRAAGFAWPETLGGGGRWAVSGGRTAELDLWARQLRRRRE